MNLQTTNQLRSPVYFDRMINGFDAGTTGRHAHLGHWNLLENGRPDVSNDDDSAVFARAQSRLNSEMIRLAKVTSGTQILDVACGLGGLIQNLNDAFTDVDLTGINIDVRQLEICQRLQSTNANALRWQEADACDLPFAAATFDTVFCIEAMFHFASRERFLDEARRVLKPGGVLVLTDIVLVPDDRMPMFCFDAILNDGYGPWPDPWCENGDAGSLLKSKAAWTNIEQHDATKNTLPSYDFIVPHGGASNSSHRDPNDIAARSAMMLHWLHANQLLRYEYVSAVAGASS